MASLSPDFLVLILMHLIAGKKQKSVESQCSAPISIWSLFYSRLIHSFLKAGRYLTLLFLKILTQMLACLCVPTPVQCHWQDLLG